MKSQRKDLDVSQSWIMENVALGETLGFIESLYDKSVKAGVRKQKLADSHKNRLVEFFFTWMLAPYETFGRKAKVNAGNAPAPFGNAFQRLKEVAEDLIQRRLTGGAADKAIAEVAELFGPYAHLVNYFINKETPPGLGHGTFCEFYPEELIKPFHLGMCRGSKKELDKPGGDWGLNKKRDGGRCCIVKMDGQYYVLSKETNEWYVPNFDHIIAQVEEYSLLDYFALDGEITVQNARGLDDRQKSVGHATRTRDNSAEEKAEMVFSIFDAIPIEEWKAQKGVTPLRERIRLLNEHFPVDQPNAKKEEFFYAEDSKGILEASSELIKLGWEGLVAKRMTDAYVFGDNPGWIKFKVEETLDAKVIGFEEGTGRLVGMLGAFVVELPGLDGNMVETRVGIMDDATRTDAWNNQDKYKVIEFKANGKNKYGVPDHSVYIRNRIDL